ncbi:MAG: ATP-dependent Clp protease adapter ClpS [Verrucomicrobiota bacterium]|jgi:ATP-dependent Clp protease adaptor protein ClpS|nr:ATP-dependent Clp protease adapter ClpS [Verrucomicrobiota bacterium]
MWSVIRIFSMLGNIEPVVLPSVVPETGSQTKEMEDPGYLVICWDDPVNLMDYVTHVLQKVFGWSKEKAEKHMLEIHETGKSVLVHASLEMAEHHVHQLHRYNLHATMELGE